MFSNESEKRLLQSFLYHNSLVNLSFGIIWAIVDIILFGQPNDAYDYLEIQDHFALNHLLFFCFNIAVLFA
jgi:hypothetical protein